MGPPAKLADGAAGVVRTTGVVLLDHRRTVPVLRVLGLERGVVVRLVDLIGQLVVVLRGFRELVAARDRIVE